MTEPDFDIIFEDIIEADETSRDFLRIMEELLPEASLLMVLANDTVLAGKREVDVSNAEREELVERARKAGNYARRLPDRGLDCYVTLLPGFDAVLLVALSWETGAGEQLAGIRGLLDNTIELAVQKQHNEVLIVEKEQARRQINILKKQHDHLIEDNYRQYRLNQEREKEYARKLESEIARQTAELREANDRLQEISRLKSDFLANMSHELRTPMNAIIGFADLLLESRLDHEQDDYTRTIKQSAESLLDLINDILDLAKVEAGKLKLEKQSFNLPQLVNDITDMFKIQTDEKGLEIRCEIDGQVPERVLGDSHRLRQILVNLTGNAIKFTEKGYVAVQVASAGEFGNGNCLIRFLVMDTGIGIAEDRIHAVFDNFTQADGSTTREYGGTGLGLSICQQLVELMNGNIYLSSQPGQGSIFCLVIPFEQTELEERKAGRQPLAKPHKKKSEERILIVEDNAVNQRLARTVVERLGYEADVASDGLEALERLKAQEFGIVFMDVQMPRMDGREATMRIREIESDPLRRREFASLRGRRSPLQIIGLTAHARKEDEEACYGSGMDAFLSKPLVKEKLVQLLEELA